jgi:hypothetical protein
MAKPKNAFEGIGAKFGDFVLKLAGEVKAATTNLTLAELAELVTRPTRHTCLLCGQEPQEPYGAALGASCKAKVKAAGIGVAIQAGDTVKNLTIAEAIEIARQAKEAGIWNGDEES